jgi:ABC-type oligopeptide transport system substrate-binding subunit
VQARLAALSILLGAGPLLGCHPSHPISVSPAESESKLLRRGNGPEPDSLDPQMARTTEAQTILRDICEPLVLLNRAGEPIPGAAESWVTSGDGTQYTFALRTAARWSNGDGVVANDFVVALRRLVDPATASPNAIMIAPIRGARAILHGERPPADLDVSAPQPLTLVIKLEHPAPYLPALLSHPSTCPVHPPSNGATHFVFSSTEAITNGAFAFAQWVPGQYIEVRRNGFYWNNRNTYFDRVRYLHIADEAAEFLNYRADQLDVTSTIPRAQFSKIQAQWPKELAISPQLGVYYYGFDLRREPWRSNVKLRQALSLAIDRQRLAVSVLRTGEQAAYTWVPSGVHGYTMMLPLYASYTEHDRLQQAQRLFLESGYSAEHPLQLELSYNTGEIHTKLAVAIAQMWRQALGIEVRLHAEEFRVLLSDIDAGHVELFRSSWVADYNDALSFLAVFRRDSGMNLPRYQSAEYDRLLDQAEAESDADLRATRLVSAEQVLLKDMPVIPAYFYVNKHLVKPRIKGWHGNPLNIVYSKDLSE